MKPLKIAIVGFGKIARDQHVPAIAANPRYELAATVSRHGHGIEGVPCFNSHQEMLTALPELDAAAIATPPRARFEIARDCIEAGLHLLLEKPPGVTLGEVGALARLAAERRVSLFTTWHAQFNPAVAAAAQLLAPARIETMEISWREDVRKWHPGQSWIWEASGFGVFDAGINGLSIASLIAPAPLLVRDAELIVPANKQAPIAARITFAEGWRATLDWRHSGDEEWTIAIRTADGLSVKLLDGGSRLQAGGDEVPGSGPGEYAALYQRFVDLIDDRISHVDVEPLRIVADSFLMGRRVASEAFED